MTRRVVITNNAIQKTENVRMVKRFKLSFVVYIIHKPINNHDHVMFLAMAYHFFFQEVFCVSLTYAYQLSDQKEINFFLEHLH